MDSPGDAAVAERRLAHRTTLTSDDARQTGAAGHSPRAADTQIDPGDLKNPALLHQPRAQLARVQSARARPGHRRRASAARAREVPRDRRHEPRRVLHDSRGDHAEEAARGNRGRRAGRLQHRAAAVRDALARAGSRSRTRRRAGTSCASCSAAEHIEVPRTAMRGRRRCASSSARISRARSAPS